LPALRHSNAPHDARIATRRRSPLRTARCRRCVQHGANVRSIANFPIRAFSPMPSINAAIRNFGHEINWRTEHHDEHVSARANPSSMRRGAQVKTHRTFVIHGP
jgi:hypothetical protein